MKILVKGNPSVLFNCSNCDTVFMAELVPENRPAWGEAWRSKSGKTAMCKCPTCKVLCRTSLRTVSAYSAFGHLLEEPLSE